MTSNGTRKGKKTPMASHGSRKRTETAEQVIMFQWSISNDGRSMTFRVATRFAVAVLMCLVLLLLTVKVSPDIAAQFAIALIELSRHISQSSR